MNMITQNIPALTRHDRFEAQIGDLFDASGNRVSSDLGRGVYRNDTGELISICGNRFQPIQHFDVIDPILEQLDNQGYAVKERAKTRHGLYDLAGQKGALVDVQMSKNGAVMRADICLGDFIEPTGSSHYLADGPDTMLFKISIFNSHDSSLALRVNTSYERLICLNGMTRPDFSAGTYGKHTSGFSLKGMKAQIRNALDAMHTDADRFGLWAKTKINAEQAFELLTRTIAKLANKPDGSAHFSERKVNEIMLQFAREDQTVWGLFQAVTYWQTHGQRRSNSDSILGVIQREQQVATMLRTPEWSALTAS